MFPRHARLALGVILALAPAATADPAATTDPVAARLDWHRQRAAADAAELERTLTRDAARPPAAPAGRQPLPGPVLAELREVLAVHHATALARLSKLADAARANREAAEQDWAAAYRDRLAFARHLDAVEDRLGIDFEAGSLPPLAFDLRDLMALVGLVALAVVVGVLCWHNCRVARRKRARVRASVVAGVALATVALAGCGVRAERRPWAEREADRLTPSVSATRDATAANLAADADGAAAARAWADLVRLAGPPGQALAAKFEAVEGDLRRRVREVLTEAVLAKHLADDAAAERKRLTNDRARLAKQVADARAATAWYAAARVRVWVGLVLFVFSPYGLVLLGQCWAWAARRRECPRCRQKTLRRRKQVMTDDPLFMKCTNEECLYEFEAISADPPRLCFPMVGVASSGKTHMLVTAVQETDSGTQPRTPAKFRVVAPEGEAQKAFRRIVKKIFRQKENADPTDLHLPYPVIFHLEDCDPAGGSQVTANLFDYAGELGDLRLSDKFRPRAVRMDGVIALLDPTQVESGKGDGSNVNDQPDNLGKSGKGSMIDANDQQYRFKTFYEDMRAARRILLEKPVPVPVAVCISKYDELVALPHLRPAARERAREHVHELLGPTLNPTKESGVEAPHTSLDVIRRRSELVRKFLPELFPGVDFPFLFGDWFGGQVMFFPIRSRCKDPTDGRENPMPKPYGVIEPILWLLHMHGYQVFEE